MEQPCDPTNPNATTLTCFAAQDKLIGSFLTACDICVQSNGCFDPTQLGGTCETVAGNAALFPGTLPDGKTCSQVFSPLVAPISERSVCLDTLGAIFASQCAISQQETPCLCGTADPIACLAGTTTPLGPAYDDYACDFNSTNGAPINNVASDFAVVTYGAVHGERPRAVRVRVRLRLLLRKAVLRARGWAAEIRAGAGAQRRLRSIRLLERPGRAEEARGRMHS